MKTIEKMFAVALVSMSMTCMACMGDPSPDGNGDGGSTGDGGDGGQGGGGGAGGAGGEGSGGAIPCENHGPCKGRDGVPECNVDLCINGFCQTIFDATGVFCGTSPNVCDGRGHCGNFMSPDATECYTATPKEPVMPLCDDGDPATHNDYVEEPPGSGAFHCVNYPAQDGFACGPSYWVQAGKCCPISTAGAAP